MRTTLYFLTWILNRRHFDRATLFWATCLGQRTLIGLLDDLEREGKWPCMLDNMNERS